MDPIISNLRQKLKENADEKTRLSGETFFKEDVKIYGLKAADAKRIGNEYLRELKGRSKHEIFDLCEQLWQSQYLEECTMACNWSYSLRKSYTPDDFARFERWVSEYVTNWAACDTLCNHTVGDFVVMYPQYIANLKQWTRSENRWMRRAAAVSLIVPAKRGLFLSDVFEIADLMITDPDDMVQKGYGWLLKAATEQHTQEVFEYVMSKRSVMPRTALRYAIEKMPRELKSEAMKK